MKSKCNEIFKLKKLLDDKNIPYEFYNNCYEDIKHQLIESFQLIFPNSSNCIMSIIEGVGTFGYVDDKLETTGLLTNYEKEFDSAIGNLSAEEVLKRIEDYNSKR